MILLVAMTQLAFILTRLSVIKQQWRLLRAFPCSDFLAHLIIQASDTTLSIKKRSDGKAWMPEGHWKCH